MSGEQDEARVRTAADTVQRSLDKAVRRAKRSSHLVAANLLGRKTGRGLSSYS